MPVEHVCECVVLIISLSLPILIGTYYSMKHIMKHTKSFNNVAIIAKRDITRVGDYSFKTTVSIKRWIYSILVKAYYVGKLEEARNLVIDWNCKYNIDWAGHIFVGIDQAYTDFRDTLQKALDNNEEPRFKISLSYDIHNYPLSFCYNDYVNPDALLKDIDSLLEVC